MLRILAFLTVASLTTGCAIRGRAHGVAYVVDATAVIAGAALMTVDEDADDRARSDEEAGWTLDVNDVAHEAGVVLMVAGVTGGVINYLRNRDPGDAPAPAATPAARPADANPQAVRLAEQARRAAAANQCPAVRELAPLVRERDEAYYLAVFSTDLPIAACMREG